MNELKKELDELISKIFDIPGLKIITLTVEDSDFICEIENKNFKDASSYASFAAKLVRGISVGGGMTVVDLYNNKKIIYGFALGENTWVSIPAEKMKRIHNTDHETGEPLPEETDVDFCDFY